MDKLHCIHSRGGRIGGRADTAPADVDAIVAALRQDTRKHLLLHFHGGLVSKESGLRIADNLQSVYSRGTTAGAYPIFYVWESGAWETIRNNLAELADEPVFKQLLRKALQYALERLGGVAVGAGARSVPQGGVGSRELDVKAELDAFWTSPSRDTIPFRHFAPAATTTQARSAAAAVSEDDIEADLQNDVTLQRALATLPDVPPATRSTLARGAAIEHRSAFSDIATREFSSAPNTRGLISLAQVAIFLARLLRAILHRYSARREHGLYATCVEEIVRGMKVAGSGVNEWAKALEWNRMKQDTIDAFGPDPDIHAGTALLNRLQAAFAKGLALDRITLVGHSTGAIYIANWLEASRRYLPATLKQDVVFLAPAITYQRFGEVLGTAAARIGEFRMFAMHDGFERDDQVWGADEDLPGARDWRRFVYPSSLLYLVSGILESRIADDGTAIDEADMPLVGMERFYKETDVYGNAQFPEIAAVRAWLASGANRTIWSKSSGQAPGLNCDSIDHGAFDDNPQTLESLRRITEGGYA